MRLLAVRLADGTDLKQGIIDFAKAQYISAGVIVNGVGALKRVTLRMAGATPNDQDIRDIAGPFEITSLAGTVSDVGEHFHITLSDAGGGVIGGHLKGGIIDITVELVIAVDDSLRFTREFDETTGFDELQIRPVVVK